MALELNAKERIEREIVRCEHGSTGDAVKPSERIHVAIELSDDAVCVTVGKMQVLIESDLREGVRMTRAFLSADNCGQEAGYFEVHDTPDRHNDRLFEIKDELGKVLEWGYVAD